MPGAHEIVHNSKNAASPDAYHTPVHFLHTWADPGGPEAEKYDDNVINYCESVDQDTPDTGAMEWSPDKLRAGNIEDVVLAVIK